MGRHAGRFLQRATTRRHSHVSPYELADDGTGIFQKPIGNMDLLIASHAVSEGYAVVTNNIRHFSYVPGLEVKVWQ